MRLLRLLGLLALIPVLAACGSSVTAPEATLTVQPLALRPEAPSPPAVCDLRYFQSENLRFGHLSVEQGLSQSTVYSVLQDRRGFMWFGTQDGLNRYDGYDFTVYKPVDGQPDSLGHHFVHVVVEDPQGYLWVGTDSEGVDRYDPVQQRFSHFRYSSSDPYSLSSNFTTVLYVDRSGVVWVGTRDGLNRFDPGRGGFIRYTHNATDVTSLGSGPVASIYQDRQGVLWVGTEDGALNRLEANAGRFTRYIPDENLSPEKSAVQAIFEDRLGTLWVGTMSGGLHRFDRQAGTFTHYVHDAGRPVSLSNNNVTAIYEDRLGCMWVGTYGGGLELFDRRVGQFMHFRRQISQPGSLDDNFVLSLYEDNSGMLWIGTVGGGLNTLERLTPRFMLFQARTDEVTSSLNALNHDLVWALYQDRRNMLWVGTNGGGLNRLNRVTGEWAHYLHDPNDPTSLGSNTVRAIVEDRDGNLWVGTQDGGLDRFDRKTGKFAHFRHNSQNPDSLAHNTVNVLLIDHAGTLWVGTAGGGLDRFDPQSQSFIHYRPSREDQGPPFSYVAALHEDRMGLLWVGTGNGLVAFEPSSGRYSLYRSMPDDLNSLSRNIILSIQEDRNGVLWVGTNGGGLDRLDPASGEFRHFSEKEGLPNNVVYGILQDRWSNLWLSTNNGLARFDPHEETFTVYDTNDGLQSREFNMGAYFQSDAGEMFFGGVRGFNIFNPDDFRRGNPNLPPVVLTALTQDGTPLELEQAVESVQMVTLSWPRNYFEFEFAALNYIRPDKNQYAYMLEGFDKNWNQIGSRRFGRYTNLPGGDYTLRLRGSNNDRRWNEQGAAILIRVVPPFWDTIWFRVLAVLMLVAGGLGSYWLRLREMSRRAGQLEILVQQRTAQLRQEIDQRLKVEEALRQSEMENAVVAERSRLARELHDAVTQTLFSASLLAEALPATWERSSVDGRRLLKELRQLSRGALAEMRTLLLELRPAALAEASMEDLLRQLGEAVTGREGIPVEVEVQGECAALPADVHIALFRITQEALNNVVRHARASQVQVCLRCERVPANDGRACFDRVTLSVCDDGRGFDPQQVPSDHLGLSIMSERAEAVGAGLRIQSQPGQGTQIMVLLERDVAEN